MTSLKFEGDLSQISDRQLEFIKSVVESRGYKSNRVVVEPVSKAGDNYIANIKRITVKDENGRTFKMIGKVAPQQQKTRMMTNIEQLFRNEHIMYTKVLPKYTQLEEDANVPPQERLRYAICYGSFQEAPHEVILLEDLNEADFVMLDRRKPISKDCVEFVLKNFAVLHSLAYALNHKEPDVYNEYKNELFDMWSSFHSREQTLLHFRKLEAGASMLVQSELHKNALQGSITGAMKLFAEAASSDLESKHSVIIQGDAWTNNVMFKFDGETLSESVMIDYQVSKASSPANDLLYMIFNCTDYETRKEHFHDWIDYYHTELDKALSNYGLKAKYVYSRDQLDEDLKKYGKMTFGQSVLLASILSMKSEEAGEMMAAIESEEKQKVLDKQEAAGMSDPETIALFKKKVERLVDSYHEFELL